MNNEEAKLILQAYRPGGQDANDPRFREALEQAQRDPELARWFANEHALDSRISAKVLAAIKPPAHLKSQLLAQRKIVRPAAWWKMPAWQLAAAACLALLVTIAAVWLKPVRATGFAQYRNEMADFTAHKLDRLDLMSRDVPEVRRWLAQKDSHGDLAIPAGLNGRPSLGCRLLDWKGKKVSLICFEMENKQVAHLLVVDSTAFKDAPTESPVFNQVGDVATASWSRGGKTYVVASKGGNQLDLMKLL
ncbi:MAG: hypothetical protein O2960_01435 [Verrucomicrobia bacterium]|nr:hypothetical protein [Verrucomicrobiota bacterium]